MAVEAAFKASGFFIFGDDYDTEDGTAIRDFIHVKDLAIAHVKAIESLVENGESMTLNLGVGVGYSVKQVIDSIERISGQPVNATIKERRLGDPPSLIANNQLCQSKLGFVPSHSDLDNIISSAIAWYCSEHQVHNEKGDISKSIK